jgi:hypothetical protein
MAIVYRTDSLYRTTPIVDNKYLGIYEPGTIDLSNTNTTTVVLTNKHHQRPDVLANELYGNPKLWWIFAQFNPDTLVDPIIDFTSGKELIVPTRFS